ncbi:DUF421 domain-containing protein [Caenispirillum bisanense]|uniref:DUF421 domain-containing protein n=1 Tax=Caenispirillum bisanense TaxID=414052 RepID=UPI0031D23E00
MFFDQWEGLLRVVVVGTLAYVALVVLLRLTGKRTLSKMNAFDFVVTVALGSTLATVLLSRDVALAEGAAAFALLIGLQMAVAWGSARSPRFRRLVKAEPRLLLHRGEMLHGALLAERVAPEEVLAAVRSSGQADLSQVTAVVLETDGTFSVVSGEPVEGYDAMATVGRIG